MLVISKSFHAKARPGTCASASLVLVFLSISACGGRSDLGFGSDDSSALDASAAGTRDSGGSIAGDSGVADGGFLPPDAGAGDAVAAVPELADCLPSPYEIHVVATDYNGTTGAFGLRGSQADWFTRNDQDVYVEIFMGPRWGFSMISDFVEGQTLSPGTYPSTDQSGASFVQIEFEGVSCPDTGPRGNFTIVDYAARGSAPALFPRMLVWFDLRCGEGRLTGCVRYGE